MRISFWCTVILVCAFTTSSYSQGIKSREILGFRIGEAFTAGELHDSFGNGSEIELHFIEGLGSWFGVNIAISSHSLGESGNREKNILFTGSDREVDLHIYSATIAFLALKDISKRVTPTVEAGLGFYSINAIIPVGFYEGTITDNRFGLYGGVGLFIKITNSFSLNTNLKYHYIFSGDDNDNAVYFYTGDERTTIYQLTVGVAIYTG